MLEVRQSFPRDWHWSMDGSSQKGIKNREDNFGAFFVRKIVRVPQEEVGKRSSIAFFVFGTLSVTFWSLFLMLLSLLSSLSCQTPFAGLLLRQGEIVAQTYFVPTLFCRRATLIRYVFISKILPPKALEVFQSGFLKRAFAQTCLRAWYQVQFFEECLGILGALCMGKGAPLVRYLCTT